MAKKYISALMAGALASFMLVGPVLAQRPEGIPEGMEEGGPDEAAIMREVGAPSAPTDVDEGPAVERPSMPGIPAEARAAVADADIVDIFCLTTKWKSGRFFAAIDALEKHLIPAVSTVEEITGSLGAPDIVAIRAAANARLDAVCSAATPEDAQLAVEGLADYGEEVRGQFSALRATMTARLQAKGDEMRARIEAVVKPLADEEKANAQAELNAYGESLGAEAQSQMESEMAGKEFSSGEAAQAYVNSRISSLRASITGKVNARAKEVKARIEARIRAAVEEAAGPEKAKFQALGDKLGGLGASINSAIAAGEAKYETYREQALAKRQAMVLAVVDKSVEKARAELEKSRAQIDEARAENPEIKSVEAVLSEMDADRAVLASAVSAALAKDDEAAFQSAIDRFRAKWEGYRAEMEKAFFSVGAICGKATAGLSAARVKLDDGARRIAEVQSRCAASVSEECAKINELAPRFAAMTAKMGEMTARIDAVDAACRAEGTKPEDLIATLGDLKAAGADLEAYGKAFEAEKAKIVADSAAALCSQAVPPLKAARVELEKDDLAGLKASLDRCRGEKTEECAAVNSVADAYRSLESEVRSFLADASKVEAFCAQTPDEARFMEIADLASFLKKRGDDLKTLAKELKVKQTEKASQKAVCAAVKPSLEAAKKEIAGGIAEAKKAVASCAGKSDERCAAINSAAGRIGEVTGRAEAALGRIVSVIASCGRAADGPADASLLAEIASIRSEGGAIKELVAAIKAEDNSPWPARIKSGKPFKVVLDEAPKKFDDSKWTGDWRSDQMGTIRGGETYTLTYGAAKGWAATGFNEGAGRSGTWTYRYGNPDDYQVDIWGRVYKFDRAGLVYDPDFGLVGHLAE